MRAKGHYLKIGFVFLGVLLPSIALAQVFEQIETGHTCSYFGETVPEKVTMFASDREAERVIQDIVDASGLVQNFAVHAAGVPNAAAVIRGERRYILYNQHFMYNTRRNTNSTWAPISIMAHEVGHHLNGHTLDNRGSRPRIELEADYYSGFILYRMGASLDDSRIAMDKLGSPSGTPTHPSKHDRLAAITSGWTKACESDPRCGNDERARPSRREPAEDRRGSRDEESTPSGPDSCEYARDGECDEPDLCPRGTDTSDCKRQRVGRDPGRPPYPTPQQGLYCCDQWGRKWCQIAVNPGPPGAPCWCAGIPGTGIMCQ